MKNAIYYLIAFCIAVLAYEVRTAKDMECKALKSQQAKPKAEVIA